MIFVVEDDHGVRELELYALRQSGYEAEGYETPTAFRQALEKTVPDCVLLDVMLPGEDGLSLLRFLRRDARTRRVPVILVTARDTEMDKVKGLDCGADDFEAEDDCFTIYTQPDDFNAVAEGMTEKGYSFVSAQIEMVPGEYKKLENPEDIANMEKMLDIFEDDDDVQNVWHNWDRD